MKKILVDFIYLAACGVHGVTPEKEVLDTLDLSELHKICRRHFLTALVGSVLKAAGAGLPKEWEEDISKAVRKNILFDVERAKLFDYMENKGIWHMPLKGIILKEYYPMVGMRQMSDNDILFDCRFCDEVQAYMNSQGYEGKSTDAGVHDVYQKAPVYNFEMHRALYGAAHDKKLEKYYENVKDRLLLTEGTSCEYHFTDEDFYVYITSHAYKHYEGRGTGLRTLLDFYVYLSKMQSLDFAYIEKECEVLGIAEFEKKNRSLCKKIFAGVLSSGPEFLEQGLSAEEQEMLCSYLRSGIYGSKMQGVENAVKRLRKKGYRASKLRYMWERIFPGYDTYRWYAPHVNGKFLQSLAGWTLRVFAVTFTKSRREQIAKEIDMVKEIK